MKTNELYNGIIPRLVKQGRARPEEKIPTQNGGTAKVYAFKIES